MMTKSLLATLTLAILATGAMATTTLTSPRRLKMGHGSPVDVVPFEWTGVLEPGREPVTLSGASFDEIEAKAKLIQPHYSILNATSPDQIPGIGHVKTGSTLPGINGRLCDVRNRALLTPIHDGVDYLRRLRGGVCRLPAGPRLCSRVSCSWDAAIWWCNDNAAPVRIPCHAIAEAALEGAERCKFTDDRVFPPTSWTSSQTFTDENWNVIVGKDAC